MLKTLSVSKELECITKTRRIALQLRHARYEFYFTALRNRAAAWTKPFCQRCMPDLGALGRSHFGFGPHLDQQLGKHFAEPWTKGTLAKFWNLRTAPSHPADGKHASPKDPCYGSTLRCLLTADRGWPYFLELESTSWGLWKTCSLLQSVVYGSFSAS